MKDSEMPEKWRNLKASKLYFQGELIPAAKLMDEAADLMREMAEALEQVDRQEERICAQTYKDIVEPVLKKFREWK